ncbi:MAG: S-layer homology domain-containing protein [Clostridia bacterium]|nr:S-layer homology domain-containing protein [Clostridia bacterium]
MKKLLSLILAALMLAVAVVTVAAEGSPFSDVKESRWSYKSIVYALDKGYLYGVGDGKFDPAGITTRGMLVTVLYRLAGDPEVEWNKVFDDLPQGKYYSAPVVWAKENSIVNGVTETSFDPKGTITREQMATMLYRYAEFASLDTGVKGDLSKFPDADKAHNYAITALTWATDKGLIAGVKSGDKDLLDPRGNATREQFSTILMRFCEADLSRPLEYNSPVPISTYTEPEYPLVTDADVYVATDGDDTNPGTLEAPVKTFERARGLVREKKATATDEIVVAFKAGDYGTLDSLTLTSEDSGTEAVPIRYCKYGDGDVTFNNGVTLKKEEFEPLTEDEKSMFPASAQDGVMKLDLDGYFPDGMPDGLAIFGDDGLIWEARHPNKYNGIDDYMKNEMVLPENKPNYYGMTFTILPPLSSRVLDKVSHFKNMKITGYIMYGWRVDSLYIKEYDKDTHVVTIDDTRLPDDFWSAGIRTPQMKLDEIYVENSPDFLDVAGEYWYDPDTNVIYVYDPCDEYNIGLGGNFLTFDGANYISLTGLAFRNGRDSVAVDVMDSSHITLDRCAISGVDRPVEATGASDWLTVTGCEFSRYVRNGIKLRQTQHWTTLESNHVVIDNNYFHDYGLSKIFANPAISDSSIGARISHNLFRNSPNGAVTMGTLSVIEYNIFDNMMTSTQDFGVLYANSTITEGRRNVVRYNLFLEMNDMNGATYGLYMDDFTQDQYIYGNLFYKCGGCGVMLHLARDQFVYENAFIYSNLSTNDLVYFDFEKGKVRDGLLPDGTGWEGLYNSYYNKRVNEGEEGYEIWKATFPSLYAFEPDIENPYVYTSIFCPWDSIHNNAVIDGNFRVLQEIIDYGEVYDNMILTDDENPYFVDPTNGDYRLKDGVDFFYIPFEEMGRY